MADLDTHSAFLAAMRDGGAQANPTESNLLDETVSEQVPKGPVTRGVPQTVVQAAKQVLQKITGRHIALQTAARVVQIDTDILEHFENDNKNAAAAINAVLRDHIKMQGYTWS